MVPGVNARATPLTPVMLHAIFTFRGPGRAFIFRQEEVSMTDRRTHQLDVLACLQP
jgi:hypothetical protein